MVIASVGASCGAAPVQSGGSFAAAMEKASRALPGSGTDGSGGAASATAAGGLMPPPSSSAQEASRVVGRVEAEATRAVAQVSEAQARLDGVLRLAERGRVFSPAELLAIQADVYRSSQVLDLAGKVVERATSGVKQILTTQL